MSKFTELFFINYDFSSSSLVQYMPTLFCHSYILMFKAKCLFGSAFNIFLIVDKIVSFIQIYNLLVAFEAVTIYANANIYFFVQNFR